MNNVRRPPRDVLRRARIAVTALFLPMGALYFGVAVGLGVSLFLLLGETQVQCLAILRRRGALLFFLLRLSWVPV